MHKQPVYIFARRFKSDMELLNVLTRLDYYGAAYALMRDSSVRKLVVVLNLKKNQNFTVIQQRFSNLEFIVLRRRYFTAPFLLLDIQIQFKRLSTNPGVLISGDPYISGLLIYLLKRFRFRKSVLQFQVHGNPFQYLKTFSIRQSILKFIYLFNLRNADSIRLVSQSQLEYDFLASRITQAKCFIAPIPILDIRMGAPEGKREEGLLFLGRFHHERNLDLWLEIAENIALKFPGFKITMAGSGPLMEFVNNYKATHQSLSTMKILGEIAHSRIEEVLHESTILLSTAEHESYGLSLREAMLSGLFVVAKRNPTTVLLEKDFPNLVFTYDTATEAKEMIANLVGRSAPKDEIAKVEFQQTSKNLESVNSLVQSWITAY